MIAQFIKRYKQKLNQHTDKHGYDAVGVALATLFFISLLLIALGLFLYIFPRLVLEQDVQQFANTIRLDGYVRQEVYEEFENKLENRGYTEEHIENGLDVFVMDSPLATVNSNYADGKNLIQSASNPNPPLVARGEGKIAIQLVVPANSGVFTRSIENMGGSVDESSKTYNISRIVMSEAYRGSE